MSYCDAQLGGIYIITPTQQTSETHQYSPLVIACLLQLANPLLIHFEVGPTHTAVASI
jgi:hypothetical protein